MRENVAKRAARSLCALTLHFTSWTQPLNWVQPKALLEYRIHIAFYSALKTSFSSILLPCKYFIQWGTCRQTPFISLLPGDLQWSVCPLQCPRHFHSGPYRKSEAMLPSPVHSWPEWSASRQRLQMSLWQPRAKAWPGEKVCSLTVLLSVF